ncbi:MAG: PD-(D/E)XK nuclease family protein [Mariprofundaceae bacterium]
MSFNVIKRSDVPSALNSKSLLITASPRLVGEWKRRLLLNASEEVIATPSINYWDEWLTLLSNKFPDFPLPLTKVQELLLWEKVIRNNLNSESLSQHRSLKGLSRRASDAYALMQNYRIDTSELALGGEESEALARWITAIQSELQTGNLHQRSLTADIPSLLAPLLSKLNHPENIILDGFELFAPMQLHLLNQFKEKGCNILTVQPDQTDAIPTLTPCPDEQSEIRHVSSRIKSLIDSDPLTRISILTSDSFSDSATLCRELNRALIPESTINPDSNQQAVTIQGNSLSEWPMIEQTMHLLSLLGKRSISFSDFSMLLFSPWLKGADDEQMSRAKADALFRQQNRHHLTFKGLINSAEIESMPAFHAVIKEMDGWSTASQSASRWVQAIHALLLSTGMVQTGMEDEPLRSNIEVRQMNAFRDALISLASADAIHSSISWTQFLSILHTACSDIKLTLPSRYPNINVMPLSQIPGLTSDHIFVLSLDEQSLPPAARPQPLLPLSLQKRYDIPMSHGALQFDASTWLWQQLLQASTHIEISYTEQKGEQTVQPSSFAKSLSINPAPHITTAEQIAGQMAEFETYIDAVDMPLLANEEIRGGTAIMKNQSACPFRAFMNHRLAVASLGDTEPGIEATTKGSLIHVALEFIWNRLKSQSALLALTEESLNSLIRSAIEHAWEKNRSSHSSSIQKFEKKRMAKLLTEWLDLETKRPSFKVVSTEQSYLLKLPEQGSRKLPLHISADRIDQDGTGRKILIDYKTGAKQSPSKWLGERMEQPQLPLYALAAQLSEHDAVSFATVRTGHEMGFEGLAGEDTEIDGIAICDGKRGRPEGWQQVLVEWKHSFNMLAEEFVNGRCDVAPRNSSACNYCGLESLCRVEETGFDMQAEDAS